MFKKSIHVAISIKVMFDGVSKSESFGAMAERIIKKMKQTNAKLDRVLYEQPQPLQKLQPVEIMERLKYDRKQYREKKKKKTQNLRVVRY